MPFKARHYYMHNKAKDVCIQVQKVRYIGHKSVTLLVHFVNLGYTGKPWIMLTSKSYTISQDQYSNYIEIPESSLEVPRTEEGIPNI